MSHRRELWRGGALLALLCLLSAGCRPLVSTPPGCKEGAEACEPAPPASTAEVRLIEPARLLEPSDPPPIFGRFLPVVLEVTRSQGADEVELLCGDRRLATWWLSPSEEETLRLSALVDLLSCRTPGSDDHLLPVTLSVVSGDAVGAWHDHGAFELRADFTVEEGEQLEAGDPSAPATAWLELTEAPPTADGLPALVRVDRLLAQAPEVRIDGVLSEVWPVRDGWRFFIPRPHFDLDTYVIDVDVEVQLQTAFGVQSLVTKHLTLERALQTLHLDGDLFAPSIPKPAALPVMGSQGLVMVMEDTAATSPWWPSARLVHIPADPASAPEQLTFPLDINVSQGACASPGDPVDANTSCILGMNGTGQLVLRRPQPAPQDFQVSVLAADAWERWTPDATLETLLLPSIVDPAPYSQPMGWGRLGTERLCTEARTASCVGLDCGPFNRACVTSSGTVASRPPEIPPHASWDAGASSRARGGGPYFVTYDHSFSLFGNLPLMTLGTEDAGQVALGVGDTSGSWTYQRGITALVPVRDGYAQVSHGGHNAFYPAGATEVVHEAAWMNRYSYYAIVHVEPNGALLVLGELPDGTQEISRWVAGSASPRNVQQIPIHPDGFEGSPQPSLDLVEDGYSQTFADGTSALVYRVGYSGLPYRLLVVDADLRPLLRRRSTRPMHALPGPDGDTLWLIESVSEWAGDGNQILVLPR